MGEFFFWLLKFQILFLEGGCLKFLIFFGGDR